ncbi:hypothetical protein ACFO9Q_06565 [Paenibacillus sp. GCM10023252]|uniref:hypothetical protein n=1 Tax=Paenibacillus sp. GCM10023252 TaxID=3252649 RepID=UPI0036189D46
MLEAEQYSEAKELLEFLLQCQGEDQRHYEEWGNLLSWLNMAFPSEGKGSSGQGHLGEAEEEDETAFRAEALNPREQDDAYINQVLYIMQHHPMIDQQMLALERASYITSKDIDSTIIHWLTNEQVHPVVQFKALQCLRKRGATGSLTLDRLGESVQVEIERTPLSMDDFPPPINRIVERVERVAEVHDPTLPHFARELWKESLQFLYGTSAYTWMLRDDEETVDCYSAALHLSLMLTVYGKAEDDELRDTYGITESLRFRYEQASRTLRQVASMQQDYPDEPQS